MKKCSRCKCEVEDNDFEMYGGYCEGCGLHLCNAEIAKYGAPEWDNYNDRSAELWDVESAQAYSDPHN